MHQVWVSVVLLVAMAVALWAIALWVPPAHIDRAAWTVIGVAVIVGVLLERRERR
jgi:predicted permease